MPIVDATPNTLIKSEDWNNNFDLVEQAALGWFTNDDNVSYVQGNGQREFLLRITGADQTDFYSAGMKGRVNRSSTIATQLLNLESGSSQYASDTSVSGIAFTDDWSAEAVVELESYTGIEQTIVSRRDGAVSGWGFRISTTGKVEIYGGTGSAFDVASSIQGIPLGRKVHVAATLNMSGTSATIYIDGVSVQVSYSNSGASSITQAGDLIVGAANTTGSTIAEYFDGKVSEIRVWSVVRTAAQFRDNAGKHLTGAESNLVAYFKLNGDYTDETANANDLTDSGSPSFSSEHPYNDSEHFIITKSEYTGGNTDLTIFMPTGTFMPNETITDFFFSSSRAPHNFPADENRWYVDSLLTSSQSTTTSAGTFVNAGGYSLSVPTGSWVLKGLLVARQQNSSASIYATRGGLSTSASTVSDGELLFDYVIRTSSTSASIAPGIVERPITTTALTPYYAIITVEAGAGTITVGWDGEIDYTNGHISVISAKCAYI